WRGPPRPVRDRPRAAAPHRQRVTTGAEAGAPHSRYVATPQRAALCRMTSPSTTTQPARPLWIVLVIAAYVATIVMNALANLLPLFGRSTDEISDSFPSLFTPAGYAFSVWGLIYLALAGFVIYQATASGRADARLPAVRRLFVISCLFNVGWLLSWHALSIALSELLD